MFKNFLTVAVRSILKHKFYSFINIIGLVIGMTCCLFIYIYVQDELSYEKFHKDYQNIYRVGLHGKIAGQEIFTSTSCIPLGPTMTTEIPGVEEMLRVIPTFRSREVPLRNDELVFLEEKVIYADSNFFSFFTFNLVEGDANTILREPNSIVLTENLAYKYFPNTEAIGKTLLVGNDKTPMKVTGIAKEPPANSHLKFNAVISYSTIEKEIFQGWTGNSIQTYFKKSPATSVAGINDKLENMVEKYVGKEMEIGLGIKFEDFRKQGGIYSYLAYPLEDSHLKSMFQDDLEPSGNITYVYIFSGIGVFILVLACINFMNLSTARSAGRAKEVGLRKTLGSQRGQMIGQFLSESFVYGFIALFISIAVSFLLLPKFNLLAGKQLSLQALTSPGFILIAFLLVLCVGILAGSYPAFYLTAFSPTEVLKGKVRAGMKSKGVRSGLVVLQFAVSTFLILATVVVYKQLNFMQNKNLGLDKQNVIVISGTNRLGENRKTFKELVEGQSGVTVSSYTNNTFPGVNNTTVVREKGKENDHLVGLYYGDWDHLEVMKFELKEGRFFSRDIPTDTLAAVVNEAAVREYGFQNPLEEELTDFSGEIPQHVRIIGVVKDFNFESLRSSVRPIVIRLTDQSRQFMIRYEGDPVKVVSAIEAHWKSLAPGEPFQYNFLDQNFDSMFRAELQLRNIFITFSSLAIAIACLGLFALAAFTTEQRTKEIGVRKAMGASVFGLTLLLSKEFTQLVVLAIVPALVGGWFVSRWWLTDFTYRTDLSIWVFIGCGVAAILIAWLTVAYQSVRAARSNPVNSLRYE
ncbi:MAG TPA: ABC transporter permease [Cyclobacteriaceae bacterium]|nr:ABC transporter permease [Cyclobacteriaceae bacterium]HRF34830.1 ABC transporter permease [Cyclobacteriaceae bacterium]